MQNAECRVQSVEVLECQHHKGTLALHPLLHSAFCTLHSALGLIGGLVVAMAVAAGHLSGQRGWNRVEIEPNVPYDGRFPFARIRYTVYRRSGWEFEPPGSPSG